MKKLHPGAKFCFCNCDRFGGTLNTGDVREVRDQPSCEIAFETSQLQDMSRPEQWQEGPKHEWVHDVEVKIVGILMITGILRFFVEVPRTHINFSSFILIMPSDSSSLLNPYPSYNLRAFSLSFDTSKDSS